MTEQLTTLQDVHVEATAGMLAGAFEIDPAYRYLFPGPARRPRGLAGFFARNPNKHGSDPPR